MVFGIQVSIETQKAANTNHHSGRMMRSMLGARVIAAIGGGGGSIVASGSRLESMLRMPGRISNAATMARNGIDGTTAPFQTLLGGMYPCSKVVATPRKMPTPAAIGSDRSRAQQAAPIAVTVRIT